MIRRRLLSLLGAAAASPAASRSRPSASYDVVVVGAGAAGIAAARALAGAGRRTLVLEARDRIGGRAWTDESRLGLPFDMGASWLEGGGRNPLLKLARASGRRLTLSDQDKFWVHYAGVRAPDHEIAAMSRAEGRLFARVGRDVRRSGDGPLTSFLGEDPYERLVLDTIAAATIATDPARVSAADMANNNPGQPTLIEGGYGHFLSGLGAGLDVRTGVQVQGVDYGGRTLVIGTPAGAIETRACLVTVPTAVLATEAIRFQPSLPARFGSAFADLPLGPYIKIGLRLSAPFEVDEHYLVGGTLMRSGRPHAVHLHPHLPLATVMTGAGWGETLAREGEAAKRQFALDVIADLFGSGARTRVQSAAPTAWEADPWSMGAYASALPGRSAARTIYDESVDDRLFFAGEAAPTGLSGTVGGAWLSGLEAARRIDRAL